MKVAVLCLFFLSVSLVGHNQCQTTYANITVNDCDTYISPNNQVLTNTGTFYDTLMSTAGCDSIITINLTIHQSITNTIFGQTCGSPFVSNGGISYGSTGLYTEYYNTIEGCDSIVFVDVEIGLHTDYALRIVESCGIFISDADSVYTQSGFYWEPELEPGGLGCYSYIPYEVTIINVDPEVFVIDQTTLKATDQGTAFQWIDCNNNNAPIVGDTNQIFTTNLNGDYACIVFVNDCSDTSECFRIGSVSLEDVAWSSFKYYPNPTTGQVNFELGNLNNVTFSVFDINNKLVYKATNINATSYQFGLNQPSGIYIVEVRTDRESKRFKLVME